MKTLLSVSAIVEAGAGLALLTVPSVTASVLLGERLETGSAISIARIGGAAILALSITCWLARNVQSLALRDLVVGMLFYNGAVAAVLIVATLGDGLHSHLLWPAVAFHLVMGGWCMSALFRNQNRLSP